MIKQVSAAILLGAAFVTTPCLAQSAAPARDGGQFMTQMTPDQWRGSKLVGVDVYGTDDVKIGDISEIIVDHGGSIKAIVIGVGGFLGIGEKDVAIPFERVEWARKDGVTTTSATAPVAPSASSTGLAQTTTNSGQPAMSAPPAQTTSAPSTAASSSTMQDYPDRAVVHMTKQDLQNAPQFHYASSTSSNSGTAPATNR
ncbi:MAG: photosystem reaction center subunit [Hyphomicrobiales bacterium]|nr:photosystem reaction center subunit [Hyphomicrobiales bacterium]